MTDVPQSTIDVVRLALLEQKMATFEKDFAIMETKINEIHTAIIQVKSARWVLLGLLTIVSGVSAASYYLSALFHKSF